MPLAPVVAQVEVAAGLVDGSNTVFGTSRPYATGSLRVFINGLVREATHDDGWIELPPTNVQLKVAPSPSDVVQVYYRPLSL